MYEVTHLLAGSWYLLAHICGVITADNVLMADNGWRGCNKILVRNIELFPFCRAFVLFQWPHKRAWHPDSDCVFCSPSEPAWTCLRIGRSWPPGGIEWRRRSARSCSTKLTRGSWRRAAWRSSCWPTPTWRWSNLCFRSFLDDLKK